MTMDWQPTQDEFTMIMHRAGYSLEKVDKLWIREFIDHWASEGKRHHSQAGWTKRLAYRMIDYLRSPGLYDRLHGIDKAGVNPGKKQSGGLPEWARMPRDDEELPQWAQANGYGQAPVGVSYLQFRNLLRCKVEQRLTEFRRLS